MNKMLMQIGAAVLAMTGFGADLGSVRKDGLTVRFAECRKCPHRMKFDADAKGATVNVARLADDSPSAETLEARKAKMAERAFAILKAAAETRRPSPKRPLMGWSSWNTFGLEIDEAKIASVAEAMATNGLAAAGYRYVNIDDGFFVTHDKAGRLTFHPTRFPRGMKPLVDRIHALGLKAGIYSDAGEDTCGSIWGGGDKGGVRDAGRGAGLYGHDAADCKLHFVDTGFDFIKVDYCGGAKLGLDEKARYTEIAKAIRATGRDDVRFNVCRWAFPGTWVTEIADSWRTTSDIRARWPSVRGIIAENLYLGAYTSVGHYNDMDMLEAGQLKGTFKTVFGNEDAGLTEEEEQTHFGMWCMLSSPLLLGCDVRTMPASSLKLVTNPYLLSLNQNDIAAPQSVVWRNKGDAAYAIVKDAVTRDGTARYLALYNATDAEYAFKVPFEKLGLSGRVAAVDLVQMADIGEGSDMFEMTVPAHGARFYRLDAERRLERTHYEAEEAYLSAYHELGDPIEEEVAYPDKIAWASGWVAVRGVGNGEKNDLVWKRVHIVNAGRRRLEFSYRTRLSRHFFVQVDGAEPVRLEAKGSTDNSFKQVSLEVDLTAGDHAVRIFNPDSRAPIIDWMDIH